MDLPISVRQGDMLDTPPGNERYCTGKKNLRIKFLYLAYFNIDIMETIHDRRGGERQTQFSSFYFNSS